MHVYSEFRMRLSRAVALPLLALTIGMSLAACDANANVNLPATATAAPAPAAASDTPAPAPAQATNTPAPSSASGGTAQATEVNATLREWAIDLSTKDIKAGKVKFNVTNAGQSSHNFTVTLDGSNVGATKVFEASASPQLLELDLKPGHYTFICSLPGHASRGQKVEVDIK